MRGHVCDWNRFADEPEIAEEYVEEIINVNDRFYILASSSMADDRTRVLKHGETFGVFDRYGDIQPVGRGTQGLFHQGTRFLSRQELFLNNDRPMLLSSMVKEDNALLAVDLTNPDLYRDGRISIPRGSVHVFRSRFLWNGVSYERFRLSNYSLSAVKMTLSIRFEADFADIFEVRGKKRARKGTMLPNVLEKDLLVLRYEGLDAVTRETRIHFTPTPAGGHGLASDFRHRTRSKGGGCGGGDSGVRSVSGLADVLGLRCGHG